MKTSRTTSVASLFFIVSLVVGCSATEVSEKENNVKEVVSSEVTGSIIQDKDLLENNETAVETTEISQEKKIEITAHEYSYDPHEITIQKGETISLIFKNEGDIVHDWVIKEMSVEVKSHTGEGPSGNDNSSHNHSNGEENSNNEDHQEHHHDEFALHVSAEPGKTNTIQFIANEPGTYAYLCSIPGHSYLGMEGTITVVD